MSSSGLGTSTPGAPQRYGLEPALGMVWEISNFFLAEGAPHLIAVGDLTVLQTIVQLLLHVGQDTVEKQGQAGLPPLGLAAPNGRVVDVRREASPGGGSAGLPP